MNQNSDSKHRRINWTMGDLREALREELPACAELSFDLWEDEQFDSPAEQYAPGRRLPDCIVVSREALERVLRGELDQVPDSTPLEEVSFT
jgi:hypothetical protein